MKKTDYLAPQGGGIGGDACAPGRCVAAKKLLVLRYISPEGKDEAGYVVAIDTVSAGFRETVLTVAGSSARMAEGCKDRPVDTAIVGIVDSVQIDSGSR